ncbi:MAG: hypothetical protein BMS9Abin36_1573 [Gammaproteobacteria bacterium]|nr:MAG: hypothetical protein BMS9Abin36_1573 [Gammaproteobacteria bacterium]
MNGEPFTQQGFLVLSAVGLIVIVAFLAVILSLMITSSARSSAEQYDSTRVLYVAASGLEKGIYEWSQNSAYAGEGPTVFAAGQFTVVSNTDSSSFPAGLGYANPLPITRRHIRSTGTVGLASRTVEAIVESAGGGMLDNGGFNAPGVCPPTPASWSNFNQNWAGGNNCNAVPLTAGPDASPAITARKTGGGFFSSRRTRLRQSLAAGCAGPVTITLNYSYRHSGQFFSAGWVQFTLNGAGGPGQTETRFFSNTGGWNTTGSITFNINAGFTATRLDIGLYAGGSANAATPSQSWLDDVSMSAPGCGGAAGTSTLSWREVVF